MNSRPEIVGDISQHEAASLLRALGVERHEADDRSAIEIAQGLGVLALPNRADLIATGNRGARFDV